MQQQNKIIVKIAFIILLGLITPVSAQLQGGIIGRSLLAKPSSVVSGGAVTVDQLQSASVDTSIGVTSFNYNNQTITGGLTNPALVVILTQSNTSPVTGLTLIWDAGGTNQSMTLLAHQPLGIAETYIFGLLNPTSGNKTLAVSWTNASQFIIGSISLSHVSAFANPTSNTGTSTTATNNTVTSQINDLVINGWSTPQVFTTVYSGTAIYTNNGGNAWDGASSYDPGATSVTPTAGINVSSAWIAVSIDAVHD